jgi:hypothetical protein
MKDFSVFTVTAINILIAIRYTWLLIKQQIKPALAMWIFFSIAVAMSLITYLSESNYSLLDNILNATDLVLVVTVSIAILLFGDTSSRFTMFDKGCLVAVLVIITFWVFTRNHLITNILIQAILVIAYFPVVKRFIVSQENSEPFSVWIGMLLASTLALFSARGVLATIYTIRAVICVSLLLLLMLRIEILYRKTKQGRVLKQ